MHRDGAAEQPDLCPDAPRVWRLAAQSHGHTRRRGVVPINSRRGAQVVHDEIEVAIPIEVRQRNGVMDPRRLRAPGGRDLLEAPVAAIAQRNDRKVQPRIQPHVLRQFASKRLLSLDLVGESAPRMLPRANLRGRIQVLNVPRMAGGDKQIFVAVQVHVEEHRLPRPIRCRHTGIIGDLGERAVASADKQRVAHELRAIRHRADG